MKFFKQIVTAFSFVLVCHLSYAYYTTNGKNIIDRETGERIILRGIGLGGWLLPEGYMWGIRKFDRPWQFEKAISELIGEKDAAKFWSLYHDNYVQEEDIAAMKEWGINTLRIPLLASGLQPPEGQPEQPPYHYSEEGFRYLDSIVKWCSKYHVGVIWDLHGAPGAQNEENISNSDGQARLWTEKDKYFPRCIELWFKIADRYKHEKCIVGYDLLNEPLLKRYPYVDKTLLRKIYILITDTIRTIDKSGIVFIEGDDWAQTYDLLEPLNWDPHMAIAFHSYPPASNRESLKYWDDLRNKYNIPLWHGETGEQRPPYLVNKEATTFLDSMNVGWAWWTHKKMEMTSQPWVIPRTKGFNNILDYWMGRAPKPSSQEAAEWLFDQAAKTNIKYCTFLPDMVKSLVPLDPESYSKNLRDFSPEIINQPVEAETFDGQPVYFKITAAGNHLKYIWFENNKKIEDASSTIRVTANQSDTTATIKAEISNSAGKIYSNPVSIHIVPYRGPVIQKAQNIPSIDGRIDDIWNSFPEMNISKIVEGAKMGSHEPSGYFKSFYNDSVLYFLIAVKDDSLVNHFKESYKNDAVELYLDPDNVKPEHYTGSELLIRVTRAKPSFRVERGKLRGPIRAMQTNTEKGYVVELAIPWASIGKNTLKGYMGLEVQISDAFSKDRRLKLSWYSDRDEAYFSPYQFGVVKFED